MAFASMMRLVEQQLGDGAVRRPEFDLANPAETPALPVEGREALIAFIRDSTPERHRFVAADGRDGVVYFDRRGRAVSAVLADMEDDEINWVAMSRGPKPAPMPDPSYSVIPVHEDASSFQLTPKSRTAIEKFVFSNLPPDNKMKQGGKMIVMLTGKVAEAASVESYTRMDIAKVPCARLVEVARAMGYTGAVEKVQEESLVEAETKTFKPGTYLHLKTQTWEGWFYPLDDQKNGGLSGLQFDMEPGAKPKGKPKQKSLPSAHRRDWKEEAPPPEVRSRFEAHPDFKSGGSPKVENVGPVHVARDFMDPTIAIYWVAKSEMTEDEFAAWLRSQHIRAKVQKEKDRYSAHTQYESVTEGTGLASVTSKKTGKAVNGEVGKMTKSSISITDNLGKSHVFDRTDPDIAVQFY